MISYLLYRISDDGFSTFIGFICITLWVDLLLLSIIYSLLQEINMGTLLLGAIAGYFYARNQEKVNQWLGKQFNKHFGSS